MQSLDGGKNNFLLSVFYTQNQSGIAVTDISTGDFYVTEVDSNRAINDEIMKYSPSEIICNDAFEMSGIDIADLRGRLGIAVYPLDTHYYDENEQNKLYLSTTMYQVLSVSALRISRPVPLRPERCSVIYMTHRRMIFPT